MDSNFEDTLLRYKKFWEQLTDESVEEFRKFASPDVRYCDPMIDAKGIDAVVAYLHSWFTNLDGIQFDIKEFARDGRIVFSHWIMKFRFKKLQKKLWELDGVSKTIFDDAGKVEDNIDYWDASPMLESFPVLGKVVTLIRKLI